MRAMAAKWGCLSVIRWARKHGWPWNEDVFALAAGGGDLRVLRWATAHGLPLGLLGARDGGPRGGHLSLLQWGTANGCP